VLLEELLGQVFEVSLGESDLSRDGDDVSRGGDGDVVTEVSGLSTNLDLFLEELSEVSDLENFVLNGLSAINGEGVGFLLAFLIIPKFKKNNYLIFQFHNLIFFSLNKKTINKIK
jgi:hypothetical protein